MANKGKTCSGKKTALLTNGAAEMVFYLKNIKLDSYLSFHTKINSKWITDFNLKFEMLKCLEENIRNTLSEISVSKDFLKRTSTAQEGDPNKNRWGFLLFKSLCTANETISIANKCPME